MSDIIYKSSVKFALAILLIGCLYITSPQYLRIVGVALFSLLVICGALYFQDKNYVGIFVCVVGVVLFNPIFKITLQPDVWQIIYKVYAAVLIIWTIIEIILFAVRKKETV